MVSLLALAHERGCEAALAAMLTEQMEHAGKAGTARGVAIDMTALRARFAPTPGTMPTIMVNLPSVASYDTLLPSMGAAA